MVTSAGIGRNYVTLETGCLHYREAGDRALPTVLLLHQSPSSSVMYEPLMRALLNEFHLLAPDTPGFGGSDSLPGNIGETTIADYANAIHDLAERSCQSRLRTRASKTSW